MIAFEIKGVNWDRVIILDYLVVMFLVDFEFSTVLDFHRCF